MADWLVVYPTVGVLCVVAERRVPCRCRGCRTLHYIAYWLHHDQIWHLVIWSMKFMVMNSEYEIHCEYIVDFTVL